MRPAGPSATRTSSAHLDFSRGQTPETVALEPERISGRHVQLRRHRSPGCRPMGQGAHPGPASSSHTAALACPFIGPLPWKGCVHRRHRPRSPWKLLAGSRSATGSPDLQGIWRVSQNGSASRIAARAPPTASPTAWHSMSATASSTSPTSLLSTIWRVSIADGTVVGVGARTATGPQRRPGRQRAEAAQAGAVWVSNTQLAGRCLRDPHPG